METFNWEGYDNESNNSLHNIKNDSKSQPDIKTRDSKNLPYDNENDIENNIKTFDVKTNDESNETKNNTNRSKTKVNIKNIKLEIVIIRFLKPFNKLLKTIKSLLTS